MHYGPPAGGLQFTKAFKYTPFKEQNQKRIANIHLKKFSRRLVIANVNL